MKPKWMWKIASTNQNWFQTRTCYLWNRLPFPIWFRQFSIWWKVSMTCYSVRSFDRIVLWTNAYEIAWHRNLGIRTLIVIQSIQMKNIRFNSDILSCETLWNYVSSIEIESILKMNKMIAKFKTKLSHKKRTHNDNYGSKSCHFFTRISYWNPKHSRSEL